MMIEKYVSGNENKKVIQLGHGDHATITKRGNGVKQYIDVSVVVDGIPTGFDLNILEMIRMGVTE